jgi:hypothetical protein
MAVDGSPGMDAVVLVAGVRLAPPSRQGDCTCIFCSTFRTRHLVARAVATSLFALAIVVIAVLAGNSLRLHAQAAGGMLGAMYLFATGFLVLAAAAWYQPARRWSHRRRPRATAWPP